MSLNDKLWNWLSKEPQGDLTTDLSLCFKWLVPKLDFGQMEIYRLDDGSWLWHLNYVGEDDKGYSGRGETPALALCLAILKLVNK